MSHFLLKDRDGQTPLPRDLQKGLKIKSIQSIGELDEHEEDNIAKGLNWLGKQKSDPCKYDFWLKLHKALFGKVWSWAGQARTHELANPDFNHPREIWPSLYQLEQDLAIWISSRSFSEKEIAARFHERIETIHPFPNGNGRFGRILAEHVCRYHNFPVPTWGAQYAQMPRQRRETYIAALDGARRDGDYSSLIDFMFS